MQNRISERLTETKSPCKLYSTDDKAIIAGELMSQELGKIFCIENRPCRYVVIYIKELDKYTPVFDMTEMMMRKSFKGGYIMHAASKNFYTY